MRSRYHSILIVWLMSLAAIFAMPVQAQTKPVQAQTKLDSAKLSQLLAPIALYPDALLSQILMASTYPKDVAAAAKWSKAHTSLSGDAAVKATEKESWDPSVKSLAAFPSVLDMMGRQPQWTKSLGDAFLAQPDDVMSSVQLLRAQAKKAGTLTSTPQQKVSTQTTGGTTIVKIEPANPQIVYVPTYNPAVVYGPWLYPAYPPYYYPPPPGSVFASSIVAGIGFGVGVAAVDSLWGGVDWGHDDVNINVNRYNNINVNNRIDHNGNSVTWQHNGNNVSSQHNGNNVASQHNGANISNTSNSNAAARNRHEAPAQSRDTERDRAAQAFQQRTGHAITGYGNAEHSGTAQRDNRSGARPDAAAGFTHDNAATRQAQDQFNARDNSRDANTASMFRGAGDSQDWHQQVQRRGDYAESRGGQFGDDRFGGDRFGGGHFGRGRR